MDRVQGGVRIFSSSCTECSNHCRSPATTGSGRAAPPAGGTACPARLSTSLAASVMSLQRESPAFQTYREDISNAKLSRCPAGGRSKPADGRCELGCSRCRQGAASTRLRARPGFDALRVDHHLHRLGHRPRQAIVGQHHLAHAGSARLREKRRVETECVLLSRACGVRLAPHIVGAASNQVAALADATRGPRPAWQTPTAQCDTGKTESRKERERSRNQIRTCRAVALAWIWK